MQSNICALIPAAGLSSRMGELKALLPLGESTVLARVINLFLSCGIEDIRVITGHRAAEIGSEAQRAGARVIHNPDFNQGMFSSIKAGVEGLAPECRAFFLLPVDIPLVRRGTLTLLLEAFRESSPHLLYPNFQGKRGHPPLISTALASNILTEETDQGLRSILARAAERHPAKVLDVPVPDAHILFDMDTRTDYDEGLALFVRQEIPTMEECHVLVHDIAPMPEKGLAHGQKVAAAAGAICARINSRTGSKLDCELCRACGMLHDIAKGRKNHEAEGGRLLEELGFGRAGAIVAAHREAELAPGSPVTEQEIVFLADKLVSGSTLVPVEKRFQEKLELYRDDPEACAAITRRLNRAKILAQAVEREAGCRLTHIIDQLEKE